MIENFQGIAHHRAGGFAILFVLVLLGLITSVGALWFSPLTTSLRRDQATQKTLQAMKESLIAYAAMSDTRPGRLPCPDRIGNGISPLLSGAQCADNAGLTPFVTLDLHHGTGLDGQGFRYQVSAAFSGDAASPLNNDNHSDWSFVDVNGTTHPEVSGFLMTAQSDAAVLPLRHESEGEGAHVLPIFRDELMRVTTKRIAHELRFCLEKQASAAGHYPFPVPFSGTNPAAALGVVGATFGQIPLQEPSTGLSLALEKNRDEFSLNLPPLTLNESDLTQTDTIKKIKQLEEVAFAANRLADLLYRQALLIYNQSVLLEKSHRALDKEIATDTDQGAAIPPVNGSRVSAAEQKRIDALLPEVDKQLLSLKGVVKDTGLDLWASRQVLLDEALAVSLVEGGAGVAIATENLAQHLLSAGTRAPALMPPLTLAHTSAEKYRDQPNTKNAEILLEESKKLAAAIALNRLPVLPESVAALAKPMKDEEEALSPDQLARWQERIRGVLLPLLPFSDAASADVHLQGALQTVLQENIKAPADAALLSTALKNLSEKMAAHEDNLSLASLGLLSEAWLSDVAAWKNTPPTDSILLVPMALNLQSRAIELGVWTDSLKAASAELSNNSRKAVNAGVKTENPNSLYSQSLIFDDKLKTAEDALSRWQNAVTAPTRKKWADASNAALVDINSAWQGLDNLLQALENEAKSSAAAALPIWWQTPACAFIDTWWANNLWRGQFFYQVAQPEHPAPPDLQLLDSAEKTPLIIISSGSALTEEARARRGTTAQIAADFFEGKNSDAAIAAAEGKTARFGGCLSGTLCNDQIAY